MTLELHFTSMTAGLLLFCGLMVCGRPAPAQTPGVNISSPDGNLSVRFYQKKEPDGRSAMYYQVSYKHRPVILESRLDIRMDNSLSEKAMGLKVDHHKDWCENLVVTGIRTESVDTSWTPVCGERNRIRDCYHAATIGLVKDDNPIYPMNVEIRAYNEGVALRYYFPENVKGTYYNVTEENTEFHVPAGTRAWFANWAQGPYADLPLRDWPGESERPLTLRLPEGLYISLAEASMVDYARTKFKLSPDKPNTIVTSMFGEAELISPVGTPWRVIVVGEKPVDLIAHDDLILNLNHPDKLQGADWIKPGKMMRVMTQTTAAAKAYIDFAARQGLQYILFDWKWYGPAFSFSSDASKVAIPDLDLPEVIRYGKGKGIGVWLYVNQQALLAQSDSLFSIYHAWGVKGVKFGFVQVGSHRWTTWLEDAIRKAAENHLMVDIHDDYRPTGEQRTYPNLMTAEGIRGNEEMPDATHNTILPFTRFIAGPADYTICYYDHRIKTTHAHQLALAVVYYSPIQTVFWYDKPTDYQGEPEIEFFRKVPTVWDDTRVLQGEPGRYITTARRSGADWFVGTITNDSARTLRISLDFLSPGQKYTAHIYSDDSTVHTRTKVRVETRVVDSRTMLDVSLSPSGGQAIWLTPDDRFPAVTNRIQQWLDSGYYTGAGLIIVKDDQVLYQKYFGDYTPSTVAHIASAGKWLAAAAIAAVVDEGKLSWDDKVVKWLPSFADAKGQATLRQLLSHTSGYPDYQPPGNHRDDYPTLAESVAHIQGLPADTTPGSLFHYGGLAMQVAGRMAELAAGKDWETLFQEMIAGPLDMTNTHFTPVDTTGGHNPMLGGGARCTLTDYAHFLDMISHDGVYRERRILSPASVREMEFDQVGQATVRPGEYVERARGSSRHDIYGLGEWREETDGNGNALLLSSPSWAGAYPWIDKRFHVYGFFLARVNAVKGFSAFYASPVLPVLVREALINN